jgi:PAS domain S-box-containing protein
MPRRPSIRTELLALVLAVAVPFAALQVWDLYSVSRDNVDKANRQILRIAEITAANAAAFLLQTRSILAGLAARPAVSALDPARCDPVLRDFVALASRFANVFTVDARGRLVCSGGPLAHRDPVAIVWSQVDRLTIGPPTRGFLPLSRWAVIATYPLRNAAGQPVGAVALPIDLLELPMLPGAVSMPADANAGIISGDGTVLTRSRDSQLFIGTHWESIWRAAERLRSGIDEVPGTDGIARIVGFTPVPDTDWVAFATLPANEVYAGIKERVARSALIGLMILATVILFAFGLSRHIAEPIDRLARAARQVAGGNLSARAEIGGAAEVAEVGTQFNRMIDAGQRGIAELRESAQTLRHSEQRLRSVVDGLGPQMFVGLMTPDGTLVEASRTALAVAGLRGEDELGKPLDQTYWFSWSEPVRQQLRAAIERAAQGEGSRYDVDVRVGEGELVPVDFSLQPLRDDSGKVAFLVPSVNVIFERKRAEGALRRSEASLVAAQRRARLGSFELDFRKGSTTWSAQLYELMRRDPARGPPSMEEFFELIHPQDRQRVREAHMDGVALGEPWAVDFRSNPGLGPLREFSATAEPASGPNGRVIAVGGAVLDITERKRAEADRSAALRRFETLFHRAPVPMSITEFATGRFMQVNEAFCEMLEYPREELVGHTSLELNLWSTPGRREQIVAELAVGGRVSGTEGRARTRSGGIRDILFSADRLDFGGMASLLLMFVDVTEQYQVRFALEQANERLHALSARLLQVQEQERTAIARELHDEIGQALTMIKIQLETAREEAPAAAALLTDCVMLSDNALQQVRDLSLNLRPPQLDDLGLDAALRWMLRRQAQAAGWRAEFIGDPLPRRLAPEIEIACFRIAQEALTNAARHAQAKNVWITLELVDGRVEVAVRDDGQGFDPAAVKARPAELSSLGLESMKERAALAGGRLEVGAASGAGTQIRASFPVRWSEAVAVQTEA